MVLPKDARACVWCSASRPSSSKRAIHGTKDQRVRGRASHGPRRAGFFIVRTGGRADSSGFSRALAYIGAVMVPILVPLAILYVSYRQTVRAYPNNGRAYIVSASASLVAALALMIDYVLNVAVGISAGVGALRRSSGPGGYRGLFCSATKDEPSQEGLLAKGPGASITSAAIKRAERRHPNGSFHQSARGAAAVRCAKLRPQGRNTGIRGF